VPFRLVWSVRSAHIRRIVAALSTKIRSIVSNIGVLNVDAEAAAGWSAGLAPRATSGLTEAETAIFTAVRGAIVEQRLLPGTRLIEEELAAIYQASRMRIRRVLLALAHEGVIDLLPGRGAAVARPTPDEARSVFEARRLIEVGMVEAQVGPIAPALAGVLRACCDAETEAGLVRDRARMIAASGRFHVELTRSLGNSVLVEIVSNLVGRSSLIIGLFQRHPALCCRMDDHQRLLDALVAGRVKAAAGLMRAHLAAIEAGLDVAMTPTETSDLGSVLGRPDAG
jgi:DNA-binding GntR family transcriptional regulator